ncbi:hypothetical protein BTO20_06275 [Mycobacterium dioxanotrophicus]|uniref:Alcohol dehydrogenase n=1 Tax=Mycobacterium dioxanotrophicus TaxID=482462 RepID=A0A1Y0BZF1_9MYCO|nr:alcohol dehydrogenase catalytic domain-containing protein [Mycobacterium dioxanotrophicus]ART68245.1 hypothetical protein BTO20_06275 [Mycobacterium dioxanotrophicus]
MKAVVFTSPSHVELTQRAEPRPGGPNESLIAVIACGLCGSDARTMTDPPRMPCTPDTVLGHEIVGRIVEPGDSGRFTAGDVVVVVPNYPCRTCQSCRRGLINLCDRFDHIGAVSDGGLTEKIWVPEEFVHPVPNGLQPHVAVLAEPLACILNGTTRARWSPGEPAVVLGAGPIGLLFTVMAKLAGVHPLVVTEPDPARAGLARELGADHVVDPRGGDASLQIAAVVGERGATTVIDAVGTLLPTALQVVAKGGEILVFGVDRVGEVTIAPSTIVDKEISIHGVYIAKGTFPLALKLLECHQDLFAKIVTDVYPLDEWEEAKVALCGQKAAGKILVLVDDPR